MCKHRIGVRSEISGIAFIASSNMGNIVARKTYNPSLYSFFFFVFFLFNKNTMSLCVVKMRTRPLTERGTSHVWVTAQAQQRHKYTFKRIQHDLGEEWVSLISLQSGE